ncbi:MAG: NAD-dependent epimerase/dehydratase family protein [Bacteroidales bacterium]|nr:NAD-dependent epimerase/dehydratase family protein [Bacteroidales bacterium]
MPENDLSRRPNVLVTGGSGFLGRALLEELLDPNSPLQPDAIRSLDLSIPVDSVHPRITYRTGDIRDYETVLNACQGMDIVIHAAAIVDWGSKSEKEVYSVNVTGTENVIRACREQGVSCLVYTSSLDAVFAGKPLVNIDESQPYPSTHPNMYCRSKYLAEDLVRAGSKPAHVSSPVRAGSKPAPLSYPGGAGLEPAPTANCQLRTVIIRPSDIWGPGDPFHVGSLINMAKGGFYVRLGNGTSKCQHTYVNNVAYAHLLAAKALWENKPGISGNTYFITDGPGTNFFTFFDRVVEGAGYRIWPKNLWLPRWLAMAIGASNETMALVIRPFYYYTPKFSRFAVIYTCSDFTFTSEKAIRELGYRPKYNEKEAMEKTITSFKRAGKTG